MKRLPFAVVLFFTCAAGADQAVPNKDSIQLSEAVASVLRQDSQPGGIIELIGCEPMKVRSEEPSTSDISRQLTSLSHLAALRWSKKDKTYLVEIQSMKQSSIMNVVLPPISITNTNLSALTGELLHSESIQREAKRLRIRMYDRSIGYAGLQAGVPAEVAIIPAGTLHDDLNWIAARNGGAIWLYRQSSCSGTKTATLTWLSR
jgi:hypothetical protein